MHVMLDLETLGVRPDAAIVQVGAVLFEPVNSGKILNGAEKVFNEYVLIQDGVGTIDNGTVAWWLGQSPKAVKRLQDGLSNKALPLSEVLSKFQEWPENAHNLSWGAIGGVWSNGASFDQPVIASAFSKLGQNPPWGHRASRCCRTLFALVGGPPTVDWTGLVSHDALDDSLGQAMQVQQAMGILGR